MSRIITQFVNPPIPTRKHDWSAVRDGHEESGPYGWGTTEFNAIADLLAVEFADEVGNPACAEKES